MPKTELRSEENYQCHFGNDDYADVEKKSLNLRHRSHNTEQSPAMAEHAQKVQRKTRNRVDCMSGL